MLTVAAAPRPPAPDVPENELASRLARIRSEMADRDIDIIVLTDKKNVEYFTDYRTLSWAYKARPVFVAISADELVLFGSLTESKIVSLKSRSFAVQYYHGYLAEAVDCLSNWLRGARSGTPSTIALDYGQDMLGRGSLYLIECLRELSGRRRIVSAADAVWRVRLIKSPFEAEQKRTALGIVDSAFDQTIALAHIGITEYELCQRMQAQIFLNGAESADPIAMLFSNGDFAYGRPPTDRRLAPGHYIWTDFRATYGGYPADRNRTARAGQPEAWEIETYQVIRRLTIELAESIVPGIRCADVFERFETLWSAADLGEVYGLVSRIGHGGGLDVTEPPSIAKDDMEIIQSGMILHIEPKLERDGAVFQFEEVVYVREAGVDFLSPLSPESIPVVH